MARIVDFTPEHAGAFAELNRIWIENYFIMEEADRQVLYDPQTFILSRGGHILMAEVDDKPVGTAALIKEDDHQYELAKMAVADEAQGQGIGLALAQAAITYARNLGARKVVLGSNRRLATALRLYQKLGFIETQPPAHTPYARADIWMELEL